MASPLTKHTFTKSVHCCASCLNIVPIIMQRAMTITLPPNLQRHIRQLKVGAHCLSGRCQAASLHVSNDDH